MIISLITGVIGKIGMSLLTSFLTEKVLMNLVFKLLERVVKSTKNDVDDQLLADVRKAFREQQAEESK
ncbi:MAG: hypothetical protein V3S69_06265 [Dehalococcoidales bacterium]